MQFELQFLFFCVLFCHAIQYKFFIYIYVYIEKCIIHLQGFSQNMLETFLQIVVCDHKSREFVSTLVHSASQRGFTLQHSTRPDTLDAEVARRKYVICPRYSLSGERVQC